MTLPPEPTDPAFAEPSHRERHLWENEPVSQASSAQSKRGALLVVILVLLLAGLVFAAFKLAGPVLSTLNFSTDADSVEAVGTSSSDAYVPMDESGIPGAAEYLVGTDIEAGTYRLAEEYVAQERWDACTYSLYADGLATDENFVDSDVFSGGRGAVTIADGQLWSTYDCAAWVLVDKDSLFLSPDDGAEGFGNGAWLVGEDIRPGTYSMVNAFDPDVENDYCYYGVSDAWNGTEVPTREGDFTDVAEQFSVSLKTGMMMNSDNCGQWERVAG